MLSSFGRRHTRLAFEVFHDIQELVINLGFINETDFDLVKITQRILVNYMVSNNAYVSDLLSQS